MTVGRIDYSKFEGSLNNASLPKDNQDSWGLFSSAVYVNGKPSSARVQNLKDEFINFGAGTSIFYLPQNMTEEVYIFISPDIKPYPKEPGTCGIACSKIPSLEAVISFTFTSTDHQTFDLIIRSSELSVGSFPDDPETCQTLISVFEGGGELCASLLKHYYSVWDSENQQMGFASTGL